MQFSVEGLENVQAMIDDKINNLTEKLQRVSQKVVKLLRQTQEVCVLLIRGNYRNP